jgi:LPXTG-site transpeptidase (sortase) family protein
MYRRQRQSASSSILTFMILGVIFGVGFLLYQQWRSPAPSAPLTTLVPTSSPVPPPTFTPVQVASLPSATPRPQATIFLPTAGITAPVIEVYLDGQSWDVKYLGQNAGHLQGTAWFGQPGNIVLAGHVEMPDGRAGIFAGVSKMNLGDPVILSLNDKQQRYSIAAINRVKPDDLSVLYPTENDRLTLITCDSYDFLQNTYQDRVVVVADRVG